MRLQALALVVAATGCAQPAPPPPVAPPPPLRPADSAFPPARVFVITKHDQLLRGLEADGQIGDLMLDNGLVSFVIDAASGSLGFADTGGNLIDAAPKGGEDALKQLFGYLDDSFPRQPLYERVEPGKRGPLAVVRASGHDSLDPRLSIETEYALAPGSIALEITTRVHNDGTDPVRDYEVGDAIQWGQSERFAPTLGGKLHGRRPIQSGYLLALAERATYAYVIESGPLTGPHGSAWSDLIAATAELPPGGDATARRWFVAGDAAGTHTMEAVATIRGGKWARLRGRALEEQSGKPVEGVRVVLDDPSGRPAAIARTNQNGYELLAPPGPYNLRVEGRGRRESDPLQVNLAGGSQSVDVLLSRPGTLDFEVSQEGAPVPAKITIEGVAPTPTPRLGPPYESPGGHIALTATGRGRLELPWGRYRVIASRGPEHTAAVREVEIKAGEGAEVKLGLARAVDAAGWQCSDLHQHAQPSADSGVSLAHRAASNLAEGLEVLVATDHNAIADWSQAVASLGSPRPLEVILGDEATLDGIGHWNAYPLVYRPELPHGGAFDVRGKNPHEIVAGLRGAPGPAEQALRVVQVNHPRAGFIGYFNRVKLDPQGETLPPDWEGGFDAIEVFSSKDVSQAEAPMRDWFWLLDRGHMYTAVGGSDSHAIADQEIGYPRTCVLGSGPAARRLYEGIVKKHEAMVTNGPWITRFTVGGKGMGQGVAASRGKTKVELEVQAAPWVDVTRIELLVNGERRGAPVQVKPSEARVRYKGSIDVKLDRDAHVMVIVRGDRPLTPVVSHTEGRPPPLPMAMTNPVFVDADGDGRFTPRRKQKR